MNIFANFFSAIANPTDIAIPWPNGPVATSIPGIKLGSGWPAVLELICLKLVKSFKEIEL